MRVLGSRFRIVIGTFSCILCSLVGRKKKDTPLSSSALRIPDRWGIRDHDRFTGWQLAIEARVSNGPLAMEYLPDA